MAPLDSALRKQPGEESASPYRAAPHNIEAEQALLGAILVNNEALYRVSDFLEPQHFFEPIHRQIYEIARSLIRTGKLASPVTLKTFLPAEIDIAGLTLAQYLARVAAEATTIINAVDYGRTVYDLAIRRELINIGEDMVNVAFDAPVDFAPRDQIEDAGVAGAWQPQAGQRLEDEPPGGLGRLADVQLLEHAGGGDGAADLAFDQAEDEQRQADHGDQRLDAAVGLHKQRRDRVTKPATFRLDIRRTNHNSRPCKSRRLRNFPAALVVCES